jgi:pyrroloquinoline-quinone synthase
MSTHDLDATLARHDLNEHPFYRAWRAGTLPRSKLATYASEYAPFIESIELGWLCLGEHEHAAYEREHAGLWARFRVALGAVPATPCAETAALVDEARRSFAQPAKALGALYAFEGQQPATARSKLDGLRAHYAMADEETEYFRVHADDYKERDDLRRRVASVPAESDRALVRDACERLCRAMWSALDGIMGPVTQGEAQVRSNLTAVP